MKTICPTCEPYLLEISIRQGAGGYFCENCALHESVLVKKSYVPNTLAPERGVSSEGLEDWCNPKCSDQLYCFDCSSLSLIHI
jgi:hypothetical protein